MLEQQYLRLHHGQATLKHCNRQLLIGACATLVFQTAYSQTTLPDAPVTKLDEVVVTGVVDEADLSLTVPSLETARERIDTTPGGVDIVDAEEYKTGRASTLQDALKYSPGVYVQPRFGSEESRLSIRGSGVQRTFHLRGIKLLQDGVPLNQADGGGDFQAVEPLSTHYIEVYRGANALEYGATTLGGAINFVSPSGFDAPAWQARAEAGSFDYLRGQVSFSGLTEHTDYYTSLSHISQEGFREHAEQSNQRLFSNFGYRLNDSTETRFYLTALTSDSELPGTLTKAQLRSDPEQANPGNVSGDQKRDFDLYRIANKTTYQSGNQRLEASAFYAYKDLFHPIFQVLDIDYEDYGLDFRYTSDTLLQGRRNILTLGFSPTRGTADDDRFVNVGGARGARTAESRQTAFNLDFYAENQHYIKPDVALVAGLQLSRASRELDDKFLDEDEDGVDNSLDEIYTGFSPKLGMRYEINESAQIFANVSRSFEPPSFAELAGGPDVTPVDEQTATTLEIGTRGTLSGNGSLDAVRWDAAYYYAKVDDELLSLTDASGDPLGTVNADQTIHQGIEFGMDISFLRDLNWRQSYLFNDFQFDEDDVFNDNELAGIPRHLYITELVYHHPGGFYAGPNLEWSPQRYAVDHANTLFNNSYKVWGFKFGYRPGKSSLSWFVDARNIFDENYAASTGVTANALGLDSAQFLPGDGRSIFAGIEWKLR